MGTLTSLNPVDYDASMRQVCLAGTRKDIISEIADWLHTPSDIGNILWMHGVYGAGKSAISMSVSEHFRGLHRLGAYVFFDRNTPTMSTPNGVVRTIAYGLAKSDADIRSAVCEAITADPSLPTAPIHTQFEKLLLEPLLAVKEQLRGPILIVLDALDECGDHRSRKILVSLIAEEFSKLPAAVRIFITSRPDSDIADRFRTQPAIYPRQLDITTSATHDDILAYFTHGMQDIRTRKYIDPEWPGESALQTLTSFSGGLFIWASTALRFIDADADDEDAVLDPETALEILLNSGNLKTIDALYAKTLEVSISWKNETFSKEVLAVLGAVLLARVPLDEKMIDALLGFKTGKSSTVLQRLGCVLQWSPGSPARLLHASFRDYITDPHRSGTRLWFIDTKLPVKSLALGCLRVLNQELTFNICDLQDSHVLNTEVPDLSNRIQARVSPHLAYASEFWAIHLQDTSLDKEVLSELEKLMKHHFLHWLEILSLLERVPNATKALNVGLKYAQVSGFTTRDSSVPNQCSCTFSQQDSEFLSGFIQDGLKFLAAFAPMIAQSAPHIYLSAIPFAPSNSEIRQQFSPSFPKSVRFEGALGNHWPTLQKVIHHTKQVHHVVFSPDGTRIASRDGTVWDSETGAVVYELLNGGSYAIIAFLPHDSQRVVASAGNQLVILDSETGTILGATFEGHADSVTCVAFSPNVTQIVSGSEDNTVRVWDFETRALVSGPFKGHDCPITSVGFSLDGRQIHSTGSNGFKLWDLQTGAVTANATWNYNGSVAFSPDCRRLVRASGNRKLQVWDCETGASISEFRVQTGAIQHVAFSRDGKYIASAERDATTGSWASTIRVWDAETSALVAGPLTGHTGDIKCVAFSPDGSRIISGSRDNTLRIWDSKSGVTVSASRNLEAHSESVQWAAFSPDGKRIVSGSLDRTARVWDSATGALVAGPFEASSVVFCVAFSADMKRIVSAGRKEVRVWDLETGGLVVEPLTWSGDESSGKPDGVAFSPDGKRLVVGCDEGKTLRVWEIEGGTVLVIGDDSDRTRSPSPGGLTYHVSFSPDGRQIISGTPYDPWVRIWDSETGAIIAANAPVVNPGPALTSWREGGPLVVLRFSADAKRVAIGETGDTGDTVRVWSFETGLVGGPFPGTTAELELGDRSTRRVTRSGGLNHLALSVDSTLLATGLNDGRVEIFNSETGTVLAGPFRGPNKASCSRILFSPDGTVVMACSGSTICGWNVCHGLLQCPLPI
jgi:WD40 repeat protein